MPPLNEHYATWIGRTLTDASGHKIGRIDDIYTDDDTGQPEWLAVSAGLMGPDTHFVPLRAATASGDGVQVPFPKDRVKVAPGAGADGRLARMEKGRLYAHYGYSYAEERNRLQRSLGFDPPGPGRSAEGRGRDWTVDLTDTGAPVGMLALSPPADARNGTVVREVPVTEMRPAPAASSQATPPVVTMTRPSPAAGSPATPPPPSRGEDRGRWPDDDAIFALSQAAARPLAASRPPRRR